MRLQLKKSFKRFRNLTQSQRPLVIDSSLILLFRDLGERSGRAITLSIIIQRVAYLSAKTKSLDLGMQDYFGLFPFIDPRYLRKCLYILRDYGIWKNRSYKPRTKMAAYSNVRIDWKAVARLAKKVKKGQIQKESVKHRESELGTMCRRINEEKTYGR